MYVLEIMEAFLFESNLYACKVAKQTKEMTLVEVKVSKCIVSSEDNNRPGQGGRTGTFITLPKEAEGPV